MGGVLAQLAFLGHEASHRQVFDSNQLNEWTGRLLANLGVGMSHGWWLAKHRTHHRAPNQQDAPRSDHRSLEASADPSLWWVTTLIHHEALIPRCSSDAPVGHDRR